MHRLDSLSQKLLVYQSILKFLHNQTDVFVDCKRRSIVAARDCVHRVHVIYTHEQRNVEMAATTAELFASTKSNKASPSSSSDSNSISSYQLDPVDLTVQLLKLQPESNNKFAHRFAIEEKLPVVPDQTPTCSRYVTGEILQDELLKLQPESNNKFAHRFAIEEKLPVVPDQTPTCSRYVTGEILPDDLLSKAYNPQPKAIRFRRQAAISEEIISKSEDHQVMGNYWILNGDFQQALEEYSKAIKLNPRKPRYFYKRGITYSILAYHDLSIRDFERAIDLNPGFKQVYGRLTIEYTHMGWLEQAKSAYLTTLFYQRKSDLCKSNLEVIKEQILEEQGTAGERVPLLGPPTSVFEYPVTPYDPNMVKAAKQLLQDPGARNIVAAMFETNTVEQNYVVELFLHIRKDIDPKGFNNVYKYPLEHTLEEYPPEVKKENLRKRKWQSR